MPPEEPAPSAITPQLFEKGETSIAAAAPSGSTPLASLFKEVGEHGLIGAYQRSRDKAARDAEAAEHAVLQMTRQELISAAARAGEAVHRLHAALSPKKGGEALFLSAQETAASREPYRSPTTEPPLQTTTTNPSPSKLVPPSTTPEQVVRTNTSSIRAMAIAQGEVHNELKQLMERRRMLSEPEVRPESPVLGGLLTKPPEEGWASDAAKAAEAEAEEARKAARLAEAREWTRRVIESAPLVSIAEGPTNQTKDGVEGDAWWDR